VTSRCNERKNINWFSKAPPPWWWGLLVEVPVMLSLVAFANRNRFGVKVRKKV